MLVENVGVFDFCLRKWRACVGSEVVLCHLCLKPIVSTVVVARGKLPSPRSCQAVPQCHTLRC